MSITAMNWVWEHSPTSGNERLVLLAIADVANDEGRDAWPSITTLATKANLTSRTVQRVISRLETDGHLIIERGRGRNGTHVYQLVIQPAAGYPQPPSNCHPDNLSGATPATPPGVTQLRQGRGDTAASPEPPVPPVPPPPARANAPAISEATPGGGDPTERFFARLGTSWPLSRGQRRRLTALLADALAAGWTPEALAIHVGANTDGVRNAYAVLRSRLADLPAPPAAVRLRPEWCGSCLPATRRIEHADGTDAGRCPRCHPTSRGAA